MRTLFFRLFLLVAAATVLAQHPNAPLYADSTLRIGSGYGSAGDLFAQLPGTFYFDRGSIGLPASGALFAAPPSQLALVYDHFRLDDPLTGRADLNIIPVESIARQTLFADPAGRAFPDLTASQTLEMTSRDLATDSLRSQVAYRTGGNGYDDIDVRAGLRYSQHLRVNAGGVLKNYAGITSPFEKYRSQKITLGLCRTFSRPWRVDYRLLYTTFDLDLPLFAKPLLAPGLSRPHQKENRYDHGLELLYKERWQTRLQITDHHRERYGFRHSLWDEGTDALRLDLRSTLRLHGRNLDGMTGLALRHTALRSGDWGDHDTSQLTVWGQAIVPFRTGMALTAQLALEEAQGEGLALLPQLQLRWQPAAGWQGLVWMERSRAAASLAARFEQSPFGQGDPDLAPERADHLGIALHRRAASLQLFAAAGASHLSDAVLLAWETGRQAPLYQNQPEEWRFSLDGAAEWRISSWLTLWGKGKQMVFQHEVPCDQPRTAAAGWLQLNHRFFAGDLDLRLRFGCSFWGERQAPLPWYVEVSTERQRRGAATLPWFQASAVIKDAALFFMLQNPLGTDLAVTGAYPQPKGLIRWGFVWNFYN